MRKAARRRAFGLGAVLGAAMLLAPAGAVAHTRGGATIGGFSTQVARAAAITAGGSHTCALTRAGAVKCWGANSHGQLGDGTTTDRHRPVAVTGLAGGVTAIAAGAGHTCAVTRTGGVKCWGNNTSGQLGDGTTTARHRPVDVSGLAGGVVAIDAGRGHTCALTRAGAAECWGWNSYGQLGDATTADRHAPVAVSGLAGGVAALSTGGLHTCALTSAGAVKCWGIGGTLGDGTATTSATPIDVQGLTGQVTAIAAGAHHTCAVTSADEARCWGNNYSGQIGDGTRTGRLTPVAVSGLPSGVATIAAGVWHTCALTSQGGIKCWGKNSSGQLGDGTTLWSLTPLGVVDFGGSLKCGVPHVLGERLAKARTQIVRAHCRVGTIRRVASAKKRNTVVGQSPPPFQRRKKGARVNLEVSRGPAQTKGWHRCQPLSGYGLASLCDGGRVLFPFVYVRNEHNGYTQVVRSFRRTSSRRAIADTRADWGLIQGECGQNGVIRDCRDWKADEQIRYRTTDGGRHWRPVSFHRAVKRYEGPGPDPPAQTGSVDDHPPLQPCNWSHATHHHELAAGLGPRFGNWCAPPDEWKVPDSLKAWARLRSGTTPGS